MPVVICDRGSAVSELAKGAERGLASFVGRGGANAQLRAAGAGPSSGPNPNRCRSSQLEGVQTALYGRGRGRRHPHHQARCKAQPSVCDATPGAPPALPCKPVCRNTPHRLKGTARSSHRSHRSSPSTESLVWRPTRQLLSWWSTAPWPSNTCCPHIFTPSKKNQEERRTRSLSLSLLYPSRLTHSTHTNYPTRSSTPHHLTSSPHL